VLVESILRKAPEIPQALRELVVGGAEGIPFYIEEIIKMLIDQQVILPGADQWSIEPGKLAAARLPPTLQRILQVRLDRLSASERVVIYRASVLGRVFWDQAVAHLGEPSSVGADGVPDMNAALASLRQKELIFRHESSAFTGTVEYAFKHDLLRSAAYENLLRKTRRQYHARAAEWLIQASGERSHEFAGIVAPHFEQGERHAEAADWYGRAGEQARAGYAPASAIDYFRKALSMARSAPESKAPWAEWLDGLIEALGAQARFTEAEAHCNELAEIALASRDAVFEARVWNHRAFLNERQSKNRLSIESATEAEKAARRAGPAGLSELIHALHLKSWAYYRIGDAPAVLRWADEALRLCEEFHHRQGFPTTYKLHGVAHLQLGEFARADECFEKGRDLYGELGDRRNTAAMWSNLGESARLRGDCTAAVTLYQRALDISRDIGHRSSETIYLANLSGARLGLGQYELAEADVRASIALNPDPNSTALTESYSFLSEACLGQGKLHEALEAAQRSLDLARNSENDLYFGGSWLTLGRVVWALAKIQGSVSPAAFQTLPSAEKCFTESLKIFEKMNASGEQARVLRTWAEYELSQNRVEAARSRLEQAQAMFQSLGAHGEVTRIRELLSRCGASDGTS
jgi:tetratricopeptide (TPR) repeat protein